MLKWAIFQISV